MNILIGEAERTPFFTARSEQLKETKSLFKCFRLKRMEAQMSGWTKLTASNALSGEKVRGITLTKKIRSAMTGLHLRARPPSFGNHNQQATASTKHNKSIRHTCSIKNLFKDEPAPLTFRLLNMSRHKDEALSAKHYALPWQFRFSQRLTLTVIGLP